MHQIVSSLKQYLETLQMRTPNKLDRSSQCININRKDVHA